MSAYQKIQYRSSFREKPDKVFRSAHSQGKSLPAINPYAGAAGSAQSVPIQMYRKEKGYKVSDNKQFAVFREGEADSKMYATASAKPAKLNEEVVTFNMVDTTDYPQKYEMKEVVPDKKMSPELIKKIHCGPFSQKATGIKEQVENENARPGRSLFVEDFKWSNTQGLKKDNPSRGSWENHYAPVIVQDGDDRGTFETAVHVDHAYFGIYGSKKGQTFRLKTVMADIELSVKRGILASDVADELKAGIKNYIKANPEGTKDDYLKQEIAKIEQIRDSKPDIDEPFREKEKASRNFKETENALWKVVVEEDVETIWEYILEQNDLNMSRVFMHSFSSKAKKEGKPAVEKKIKKCLEKIDKAAKDGTKVEKKKKGKKEDEDKSGMGIVSEGSGIGNAAKIIAFNIIRLIKQ